MYLLYFTDTPHTMLSLDIPTPIQTGLTMTNLGTVLSPKYYHHCRLQNTYLLVRLYQQMQEVCFNTSECLHCSHIATCITNTDSDKRQNQHALQDQHEIRVILCAC